ncbi:hypothetical protein [Streptomyces sp. YS-3]|uniref:hypothetical protein n=1 Tax=Streptomyces sp. YS-3 TaxID=3381352 RepID=UPI003862A49B
MVDEVHDVITPAAVGPQRYQDSYRADDSAPGKARRDVAIYLRTWHLDTQVDPASTAAGCSSWMPSRSGGHRQAGHRQMSLGRTLPADGVIL